RLNHPGPLRPAGHLLPGAHLAADCGSRAAAGTAGGGEAASLAGIGGEAGAVAGGDGAGTGTRRAHDLLSRIAPDTRLVSSRGRTRIPRHRRAAELDPVGRGCHLRADRRIRVVVGRNPRHVNWSGISKIRAGETACPIGVKRMRMLWALAVAAPLLG